MKLKNKIFIVIEGFDGTGKTSLLKRLYDEDYFILTTPLPDRIYVRDLFEKKSEDITRFLYYVGENIEISKKIKELPYNKIACDRYIYSSLAYHLPFIPDDKIKNILNSIKEYLIEPDLVVYLTCSEKERIRRINKRKNINIEKELNKDFAEKIINAYQSLIKDNWVVIDTSENGLESEIKIIKEKMNGLLWKLN